MSYCLENNSDDYPVGDLPGCPTCHMQIVVIGMHRDHMATRVVADDPQDRGGGVCQGSFYFGCVMCGDLFSGYIREVYGVRGRKLFPPMSVQYGVKLRLTKLYHIPKQFLAREKTVRKID